MSTALDTSRLNPASLSEHGRHLSATHEQTDESDSDASPWASTRNWESHDVNKLDHQITGFAVASSKRNAEFHSIFADALEDDYLIEGALHD